MQTAWPLNVVTFLQSIHHKSIYIKVAQFLDEGFKTLILGLDFQSFKSLIEALYCLLLIHIAFAEAGKEIVIHLWTTNCFPIPRTCSGRGFDKISSLTGMPKNSTGVFYKYMKGNMFNSQDGGVYFLRIPPCILHACMMKSIWIVTRSYCISFPFLFFSFFFPISSTRKTVSWKMSALDIYSIILLIEILHMSTLISLNKKELYEEHVQNSYSDRKGSDKVYQGSYKKTCYLKLSLGRR